MFDGVSNDTKLFIEEESYEKIKESGDSGIEVIEEPIFTDQFSIIIDVDFTIVRWFF